MAVEKDKLEAVFKQLPEELRTELLAFAEALLHRRDEAVGDGSLSVRSFFGVWDSGNHRSADNDQIDNDLAREFSSPHEADE
jgi:hypothetical protein